MKKNRVKRIGVISLTTVVAVVAGYVVYSHLPFVKVNKAIAAGNKYSASADYEAAINSYNEAIELDAGSVEAYNNMAGAYLSIDDSESAKKVLYDGWQNTDNENLLNNYHTVIMNEAVNTMNRGEGNIDTVLSVLSVIEDGAAESEVIEILNAAYDRCFSTYAGNPDALFRNCDENASCTFSKYQDMLGRMLSLYQTAPSEELKAVVLKYAVPNTESFSLGYEEAILYGQMLSDITNIVGFDENVNKLYSCITDAQDVQSVFADIFTQLDVGNVDELRGFVISENYLTLRDKFLNGDETLLENTTYIPVSREYVVFNRTEDKWTYRFPDFEENVETKGVITIWANYFEDDGVQRCSVSYEPAAINGNVYPHTKYSVTYLKSYITQGSSTKVAKLNYRLATEITDEDGNITETIVGDWGGANEWTMDIETIESRIRA